ncbi:TIGR01906 family membrane protein [Haloplasma contractile]|uniref:Integral membrane protein n=1 Tax=Haloplasma contractile SSD-17B TaxID=1033810 RepID=U2EAE6_9MOLU|nr:TIGR01906 family membrane protein [Haloplasma contractile]ERJ12068.1 hypothetical protein HLPCO_001982 [Haloplasma contractile SSD-17B]
MKVLDYIKNEKIAYYKWLHFLVGLTIALFLIATAAKFTLNFKPLYYFDIDYLNITQYTDLTKDQIIENYDVLIDYLRTSYKGELEFPSLKMSEQGKIHFEDVKAIFIKIDYLIGITLILSIMGSYFLTKNKVLDYLKWSAMFLIGLPVALAFPFALDFNATFNKFHELFFTNDYWLFNPKTDPVINILPQTFFMHAAILILVILSIESFILYRLYLHFQMKLYQKMK